MSFFNWKIFTFKTSAHRIDPLKTSISGIKPAGSLHKRSTLHNPSISRRQTGFSLISSPINPLSPQYNSYVNTWKKW
jgi:hypothetical protein